MFLFVSNLSKKQTVTSRSRHTGTRRPCVWYTPHHCGYGLNIVPTKSPILWVLMHQSLYTRLLININKVSIEYDVGNILLTLVRVDLWTCGQVSRSLIRSFCHMFACMVLLVHRTIFTPVYMQCCLWCN